MRKITFKPLQSYKRSKGKERITVQFRVYDANGGYTVPEESTTGNFTIHLKDMELAIAKEIVVNALMNSKFIDTNFVVEE